MSRQRANLFEKWPPEAISEQVAQGALASVQIYMKSGLRKPFPSNWTKVVPPACTSIGKVAAEGHIPAARRCPREVPPDCKSIGKLASGNHFPLGGSGKPGQRTNLYLATNPYRWTLCGNLQGMRKWPH